MLTTKLDAQDISKRNFWDYVKRKFEVESRNDMTELQWTELAAELKAAETTQTLFDELVKRIKGTENEDE